MEAENEDDDRLLPRPRFAIGGQIFLEHPPVDNNIPKLMERAGLSFRNGSGASQQYPVGGASGTGDVMCTSDGMLNTISMRYLTYSQVLDLALVNKQWFSMMYRLGVLPLTCHEMYLLIYIFKKHAGWSYLRLANDPETKDVVSNGTVGAKMEFMFRELVKDVEQWQEHGIEVKEYKKTSPAGRISTSRSLKRFMQDAASLLSHAASDRFELNQPLFMPFETLVGLVQSSFLNREPSGRPGERMFRGAEGAYAETHAAREEVSSRFEPRSTDTGSEHYDQKALMDALAQFYEYKANRDRHWPITIYTPRNVQVFMNVFGRYLGVFFELAEDPRESRVALLYAVVNSVTKLPLYAHPDENVDLLFQNMRYMKHLLRAVAHVLRFPYSGMFLSMDHNGPFADQSKFNIPVTKPWSKSRGLVKWRYFFHYLRINRYRDLLMATKEGDTYRPSSPFGLRRDRDSIMLNPLAWMIEEALAKKKSIPYDWEDTLATPLMPRQSDQQMY